MMGANDKRTAESRSLKEPALSGFPIAKTAEREEKGGDA